MSWLGYATIGAIVLVALIMGYAILKVSADAERRAEKENEKYHQR